MISKQTYCERLSSTRTETLFVGLTALCLGLSLRRAQGRRQSGAGLDRLAAVFLGLSAFFLFYALNYRTLAIHLTSQAVELRFGIFSWKLAMDNVEQAYLDETSLWRIAGAGIHFSPIQGRYRAMFNFLEYPRVVIRLKQKQGPVRDIAFSTRHPQQILRFIQETRSAKEETKC